MSAEKFLQTIYALRTGNQQLVVDMIFANIDNLLTSGRFEEVDELLSLAEPTLISTEGLLAIATVTLTGRPLVTGREAFLQKSRDEISRRGLSVEGCE